MTKAISYETPEQNLQTFIEASIKSGCEDPASIILTAKSRFHFMTYDDPYVYYWINGTMYHQHILGILLSTCVCKSLYGYSPDGMTDEEYRMTGLREYWDDCSCKILEAWHSGIGSNYRDALEMAVSLIPKSK